MRVAKFCKRNIEATEAGKVINILRRDYQGIVEPKTVGCFKRCLECRVTPFCRIQLTTIEAKNVNALVKKIIQTVNERS
ncbi:YuzB family protein [Domibacillus indicus]|uniref:DUF1450 domain-containing protein n=1 Tax=Domibacillus indicus TaxID=1437523 RepID=UPI0020400541|nr:DUF1450 domain-containing protein [Domibacillus indicus]MCM3790533.1 YuzB family protein [Domibacillus indicus]